MRWVLYVGNDKDSRDVLMMIRNVPNLKQKLKAVKINMRLKEPIMKKGKNSVKTYNKITNILMEQSMPIHNNTQQKRRPPPMIPQYDSYDDRAYSELYSEDVKSQIPDDDEFDDQLKGKKKEQYDQQYSDFTSKRDMKISPGRVPIEEQRPAYNETLEEKKEDELMNYYNSLLKP